ncbi:MAG: ATP-binding cassette domain-containing protein [Saccharofermentanales bacterium]
MLQIKHVSKTYASGPFVQKALDDVTFNLRESEFVAVLGPSGSGKTTLLNIIGGLDRYDDGGDMIINGVSTKDYTDRDWDAYRNHTVGFVFQSYNLISHQTVLANVELALTISGIPKEARRERAMEALAEVGLEAHAHKRPNQLSGGQMQRVAIARALVNDPDILLADEPTGALDSETGLQVMELLKTVAKDRLVVLVTHNIALAEQYATRIIHLKDGRIVNDTDPLDVGDMPVTGNDAPGRAFMSFATSLALSFNNLRTKRARTFLTALAGSIGIIGIALILALSTGVNMYISDVQRDTMTSYPVTIDAYTIDLSSLLSSGHRGNPHKEIDHERDAMYSNSSDLEFVANASVSLTENNLTDFKAYLDDPESEIHEYVGAEGIVYSYDTKFDVLAYDPEDQLVKARGVFIDDQLPVDMMQGITRPDRLTEILAGRDGASVSEAVRENYDVLHGRWPEAYDELVLVLDRNNEIPLMTLYEFGFLPLSEYREIRDDIFAGHPVAKTTDRWSYDQVLEKPLYLLPMCEQFERDGDRFRYIGDDSNRLEEVMDRAWPLSIVGIVRLKDDAASIPINGTFAYTRALTEKLIEVTDQSEVVRAQRRQPDTSVLTNMTFAPQDDATKAANAAIFLRQLSIEHKAEVMRAIVLENPKSTPFELEALKTLDDTALARRLDGMLEKETLPEEVLVRFYDEQGIDASTYDEHMTLFGVVSLNAPKRISIYTDTFENKNAVSDCIDHYNAEADRDAQISYTDYIGLLLSSVTQIVNVVTYVLIAFVALSLIVSSIMIGIITYISVLERTKEIGILRAIGASKRNIAQVFNAETFIVGLLSGAIGIVMSYILIVPLNHLIHRLSNTYDVYAYLPVTYALILVALSVVLTLLAGWLPSKQAARKDPVVALRTE